MAHAFIHFYVSAHPSRIDSGGCRASGCGLQGVIILRDTEKRRLANDFPILFTHKRRMHSDTSV